MVCAVCLTMFLWDRSFYQNLIGSFENVAYLPVTLSSERVFAKVRLPYGVQHSACHMRKCFY